MVRTTLHPEEPEQRCGNELNGNCMDCAYHPSIQPTCPNYFTYTYNKVEIPFDPPNPRDAGVMGLGIEDWDEIN